MNGASCRCRSSAPFAKNATDATVPSLSLAVAVTAIVAGDVNVAPSAGLVIETDGGTFAATVTCTARDVVVAPSLSVATAVSV